MPSRQWDRGLEESQVMALQEIVPVSDSAGTEGKQKEENLSSTGALVLHIPLVATSPQCLSLRDWHGPSYLNLNLDLCDSWKPYAKSRSVAPS